MVKPGLSSITVYAVFEVHIFTTPSFEIYDLFSYMMQFHWSWANYHLSRNTLMPKVDMFLRVQTHSFTYYLNMSYHQNNLYLCMYSQKLNRPLKLSPWTLLRNASFFVSICIYLPSLSLHQELFLFWRNFESLSYLLLFDISETSRVYLREWIGKLVSHDASYSSHPILIMEW